MSLVPEVDRSVSSSRGRSPPSPLALAKLGHRRQRVLVLLATIGCPIGNIVAAAIPVDAVLVIAFGSLVLGSDVF